MQKTTEEDLRAFLARCQGIIHKSEEGSEYAKTYPILLSVTMGKKYARIVSTIKGTNQSSAWAFVNLENGDVLKPATWSAPAKHARGNLFDEFEGMKYMGANGPAYLR